MALLWIDSFCSYGVAGEANLLDGAYAECPSGFTIVADPDGVSDGTVLKLNSTGDGNFRKVLPDGAVTTKLYAGARLWCPTLPASAGQEPWPFVIRNGANQNLGYLKITTTGAIEVYMCQDGGSIGSPTLVGTSNPVITAGVWWHVEVLFGISPASVEVRVEGVGLTLDNDVFTLHADVTAIHQLVIRRNTSLGSGTVLHVKDYYIADDQGSGLTTFIGTARVINLQPTSDDSLTWTPSAGTVGWSAIDEEPPNDAVYLIAPDDTLPLASSFGMEDLPAGIDVIKGVMTKVRAGKSDGGEGNLRVDFSVGGAYETGADSPLGVGFGYRHDVFTTGYTPAEIDAAKVKITRTS